MSGAPSTTGVSPIHICARRRNTLWRSRGLTCHMRRSGQLGSEKADYALLQMRGRRGDKPDIDRLFTAASGSCATGARQQAKDPVQDVVPVQRRRAHVLGAVHQHQRRGVRRRLRWLRETDQLPCCENQRASRIGMR